MKKVFVVAVLCSRVKSISPACKLLCQFFSLLFADHSLILKIALVANKNHRYLHKRHERRAWKSHHHLNVKTRNEDYMPGKRVSRTTTYLQYSPCRVCLNAYNKHEVISPFVLVSAYAVLQFLSLRFYCTSLFLHELHVRISSVTMTNDNSSNKKVSRKYSWCCIMRPGSKGVPELIHMWRLLCKF